MTVYSNGVEMLPPPPPLRYYFLVVVYQVEYVDQNQKFPMLIRTLNNLEGTGLVLVFTETKRNADYLEYQLSEQGYPASSIHGDKTQREREDALRMFKTAATPILVATDVAARGLDINNVTQVGMRLFASVCPCLFLEVFLVWVGFALSACFVTCICLDATYFSRL